MSETLSERPYYEGHNCKSAVRQKGPDYEVRCKSLPFQHGHRLRGVAAPGWKKNFHRLYRDRGRTGCYHGTEVGVRLSHLIYNDPLGYADLILNGEPEEYLKNVAGSHGLED